jgi:hypothetical protein
MLQCPLNGIVCRSQNLSGRLKKSHFSARTVNRASHIFVSILTELSSVPLKLKLNYDGQSVDQSVLVSDTYLGLATNFSFSLKFHLDSCGFVIL